ncbi:MAG: ABC transporter permease [Ilumatobacteraceae bacterium]
MATPLLLAGLAGLWAERVGIVNIAIEGMMVVGSWFGGWGAWHWGSWAGIGIAILAGVVVGLLHAIATVHFNVDHAVAGIAVNILAAGTTEYLSIITFKGVKGAGESQSPPGKGGYGEFDMPFLTGGRIGNWSSPDLLGWIEKRHNIPLIPDLAGFLKGVLSDLYVPTIVALALVPASMFVIWRTRFGLRMRASGESPQAGESLGVRINKIRYQAMAVSGGLAAFGGAYLSCVFTNSYRQGQVAGQGYIGMATTTFGNWMPLGVLRGALVFGFPSALKYRDEKNVPALFLVVFIIFLLVGLYMLIRKRTTATIVCASISVLGLVAYITIDKVPQQWVAATPYLVTLFVLAGARQKLRGPRHAGLPYRPGENH